MNKQQYIVKGHGDPAGVEKWLNEQHQEGYDFLALTQMAGRPKFTAVMRLRKDWR